MSVFSQDLLTGKYYRDRAEMKQRKIVRTEKKREKEMQKPQLPPK